MMIPKYALMLFFFVTSLQCHCEYMYPVASTHDGSGYLFYQKSLHHVELWEWDSNTKHAQKALLSSCTPAGVRLLPDGTGFSFIDNGRIRIKQHAKRSPRAIDVYQPLHTIGIVDWVDGHHGYFSAQEGKRYALFNVTLCGLVEGILKVDDADCVYPQRKGDTLFYIERSLKTPHTYAIKCMSYDEEHACHLFNESSDDLPLDAFCIDSGAQKYKHDGTQSKCLINFNNNPIIFLTMIDDEKGFVIGHPPRVDKQELSIPFTCHFLQKHDHGWTTSYLFSFFIPTYLLIPSMHGCLYESFLPVIPFYKDNSFYFSSTTAQPSALNVYQYTMDTGIVTQKTDNTDLLTVLLPPRCIGNQLVYGGSLTENRESGKRIPFMMLDSEGEMQIQMPYIEQEIF